MYLLLTLQHCCRRGGSSKRRMSRRSQQCESGGGHGLRAANGRPRGPTYARVGTGGTWADGATAGWAQRLTSLTAMPPKTAKHPHECITRSIEARSEGEEKERHDRKHTLYAKGQCRWSEGEMADGQQRSREEVPPPSHRWPGQRRASSPTPMLNPKQVAALGSGTTTIPPGYASPSAKTLRFPSSSNFRTCPGGLSRLMTYRLSFPSKARK